MLEKVPFYGQILIFTGIALGIVGLAYYVTPNLSEMQDQIHALEDESADKEAKIAEGRAIEARLPEFEREIANLERKLGDVQRILPNQTETGDLLAWIKNLGDQSNLDLKSFSPGGLNPVEWYSEFPIAMNVTGRYHDLGIFLDRVSKYSRIINVDGLSISASNLGEKSITASFTATTFVYDDEKAVTEGVQ